MSPRETGNSGQAALDSNSGLERRVRGDRRDEAGVTAAGSPTTRGLLRVSLTQSGDSASAKVAGNPVKAISICVAKASTEDAHQTHTPLNLGVLGPNWGRGSQTTGAPSQTGGCATEAGE